MSPPIPFPRVDPTRPARGSSVAHGVGTTRTDSTAAAMHAAFREFVLDPRYTCVGARSAMHRDSYRIGVYDDLGSGAATAGLAADLADFARNIDDVGGPFATFVALFERPRVTDEIGFERALWGQLQGLHDADTAAWDPSVSDDPADPRFSFSFAGMAFFIIGLHPASARVSRKFTWPALIFNPHVQFERLRAAGKYDRMKAVVRARERALQGDINPMLDDFGIHSAARQYSGRPVEADWRPPFRADEPPAPRCPFHQLSRAR